MVNTLRKIIVIFGLLLYAGVSVYIFYESFENSGSETAKFNSVIAYLSSLLTGLVGGIVALAFGVDPPNDEPQTKELAGLTPPPSKMSKKLSRLGILMSGSSVVPPAIKAVPGAEIAPLPPSGKEKLGFYYALTYILIGIAAIVIWIILDESDPTTIKNMATAFIGLMMVIIPAFFRE